MATGTVIGHAGETTWDGSRRSSSGPFDSGPRPGRESRRTLGATKSPDAACGPGGHVPERIGWGSQGRVPALAAALADRNLNVRYWSASALGGLGPDARPAVPALVGALKTFPGGSPELDGPARYYPDVRSVAAQALGAIGPLAKAAIPALKEATADQNAEGCKGGRGGGAPEDCRQVRSGRETYERVHPVIRRAIDLARQAREHGNHPFGALLVARPDRPGGGEHRNQRGKPHSPRGNEPRPVCVADPAGRTDQEIDSLHEHGTLPHVHRGHLLVGDTPRGVLSAGS